MLSVRRCVIAHASRYRHCLTPVSFGFGFVITESARFFAKYMNYDLCHYH